MAECNGEGVTQLHTLQPITVRAGHLGGWAAAGEGMRLGAERWVPARGTGTSLSGQTQVPQSIAS